VLPDSDHHDAVILASACAARGARRSYSSPKRCDHLGVATSPCTQGPLPRKLIQHADEARSTPQSFSVRPHGVVYSGTSASA